MAVPRGFARGDFDTSFPLDDRFQSLAVRLSRTRYFAATGAYWHLIAAAWREAGRRPIERVAIGLDPRAIEALVSVGLLDDTHSLPEATFERWIGVALSRRRKDSERRPKESDGFQSGPLESVPPRARLRTDRTGQVGTESLVNGGEGGMGGEDRDSLDRYHELTGFRPWGVWSGDELHAAETEYGQAQVIVALEAEGGDRNTLLKRALARLAREADRKRQKAKQRPRAARVAAPDHKAVNAEIMRLMAEAKGGAT